MRDGYGIVVLSGGLDSATALGFAVDEHGENTRAISFDYGQRHRVELDCAQGLCVHYGIEHRIVQLPKELFVGGTLTDMSTEVTDIFQ